MNIFDEDNFRLWFDNFPHQRVNLNLIEPRKLYCGFKIESSGIDSFINSICECRAVNLSNGLWTEPST